jgi:hypothetical protein
MGRRLSLLKYVERCKGKKYFWNSKIILQKMLRIHNKYITFAIILISFKYNTLFLCLLKIPKKNSLLVIVKKK